MEQHTGVIRGDAERGRRIGVTEPFQADEAEDLRLVRVDAGQRDPQRRGQLAARRQFERIGGTRIGRRLVGEVAGPPRFAVPAAELFQCPGRGDAFEHARPVPDRLCGFQFHGREERALEAVGGVGLAGEQAARRPPHRRAEVADHRVPVCHDGFTRVPRTGHTVSRSKWGNDYKILGRGVPSHVCRSA